MALGRCDHYDLPMSPARSSATAASARRTKRSEPDQQQRIIKALAHPLRAQILIRLGETVLSPNQLAQELDASLGVVSYHVRVLLASDCVELVDTRPVRGAIEHFYRATERARLDEPQWRQLPAAMRRTLIGQTASDVFDDLGAAWGAGQLDDPEVHVTRTTLELDQKGWAKLNKLLGKTLDQAMSIHAESAGRLAEGKSDETLATELAMLHFHRAPKGRRKA
jgi:DNA-binding transcriptional ArsR family regulator